MTDPMLQPETAEGLRANPAAMTERLIDAAIYAVSASGVYVGPARKEVNDARAAIEAELASLRESLAKEEKEGWLGRDLAVMAAKIAESTAREEARSWRSVAERCKQETNAAEARALLAESRVAEAKMALEPFASAASFYNGRDEKDVVYTTVYDLRRARTTLASLETKETDDAG